MHIHGISKAKQLPLTGAEFKMGLNPNTAYFCMPLAGLELGSKNQLVPEGKVVKKERGH